MALTMFKAWRTGGENGTNVSIDNTEDIVEPADTCWEYRGLVVTPVPNLHATTVYLEANRCLLSHWLSSWGN